MTTRPADGDEPVEVVPFDGDPASWDRFVGTTACATFCHLAGWREIMADVLGHECVYAVAVTSAGEWAGALPMVRVRSRLFGDHLVSVPFLNYGGPLGSPAAERALMHWAFDEARRRGVDGLELRVRHPPGGSAADPLTGMGETAGAEGAHGAHGAGEPQSRPRKVTVLLDLPETAEALWKDRFPSKLRSQIRRPQKEGFEVRFGAEHAPAFYEVFSRNMRDLGTPVLPRALFDRLPITFPDHVVFGVVYDGSRPIAGGCGFAWGGEFEMTWASALREYSRQAPNMLLYWAFMEEMIRRGVKVFNFGRCTPGVGTHRFKLQWGGTDVPLPWVSWAPGGGASGVPTPDRPVFRWATAAWRRLPVPVTNRLGPWLSRQIATF